MTGSSSFWFANTGAEFYNGATSKSARFRQPDSSYLSKNFSSDGNTKTMTFSWWFKRGQSTQGPYNIGEFFNHGQSGGGGSQSSARITLEADKLNIAHEDNNATSWELISNNLFRDSSNWYHFVVAFDTTQSTNTNRVKAYVNGTELTYSTASYPSQDADMRFGQDEQYIGVSIASGSPWSATYLDGYMCDINFVDGTALTPTSFGETKEGVWIPKEPSVTYGTNGYRLEFKQTGTGTASTSTIGADTSGNTNHWTTNNFASDDSNIPDNPENNFATLNSMQNQTAVTLSDGNLKAVGTSANWDNLQSTFAVSSGKWYWEVKATSVSEANAFVAGIHQTGFPAQNLHWFSASYTASGYGIVFGVLDPDFKVTNGSNSAFTLGLATNDILQFRLNLDDNELSVSVDGSDKGKLYDITANVEYTPALCLYNTSSATMNFGQDSTFAGTETAGGNADENGNGDFHSAVPSGYLALCSANLSEPTLGPNADEQANDHFDSFIYSGNSDSTRTISGFNFQADFMWNKARNQSFSHRLYDSTRGNDKGIFSNNTSVESTHDVFNGFTSDGFNTTTDGSAGDLLNYNGGTYVAWIWKANGGTTTTNDASSTGVGDIDSVYQANTTAGFSIVTYTGDGQDNTTREIAHGLGVKPRVVMVKNRSSNVNWRVYHEDLSDHGTYVTHGIILNSDGAQSGFSSQIRAVSSTTFTVRDPDANGNAFVNKNNDNYVAYCFAEILGYSKHGIYEGNGSTDGTFIHTGFTPRWIMTKRIDSTDNWAIYDSARDTFNVRDSYLYADLSQAEATYSTAIVDFLSNGFKWRGAVNFGNNSSGTYIYMAFASLPFKHSNAV